MGNLDEHVYGLEELEENEFGIKYFVNNKSFLQVNTDIKNLIYEKIVEVLAGEKNIIDAYSGAGLLSSVLTKTGAKVVGVEIVKEATENANKLKKINNLYNLTNKNGNCAKEIPLLSKSFGGDFSVVVDPPRKGVDKQVVEAFLEADPKKIVYLSCNPATLARDLKLLLSKYKIAFIQGYDMFPQTANVETLVVLEKESK
jgi:23S rRNA (uracil1939-C5)-methyltransferase